jgi:signal transduction histidine kinase
LSALAQVYLSHGSPRFDLERGRALYSRAINSYPSQADYYVLNTKLNVILWWAGTQPRSDQMIEVNRVVTESVGPLQRLLGSRIELKTELATDAGRVRAAPVQLQQILMNLAVNARDAMPSGGRLTIRTSRTDMAASETDAPSLATPHVTLQVEDTGFGMDETTRARVFEPFFSTKQLEKGTGLGLATVHSIISKLGGHIEVQSSPGHGTCFSIRLPSQIPTWRGHRLP